MESCSFRVHLVLFPLRVSGQASTEHKIIRDLNTQLRACPTWVDEGWGSVL